MQGALFPPAATWRPPTADQLFPWAGASRVSVDVETKDPELRKGGPGGRGLGPGVRRPGCHMVGFSLAVEDGPRLYVPLRHQGGDNVADPDAALRYLRDQAREFDGYLVGCNLGYDLDWLAQEGVEFPKVKRFRDIQVADPLIDELQRSYSMDSIAQRWGVEPKDEVLLREAAAAHRLDPKQDLWRLPARFVGAYAEGDADRPLRILRRQERAIEEQELEQVWDLESRLLPVLVRMRRRGIRVHEGRLGEIERMTLLQEAEALAEVRAATGVRLQVGDVWSAEAIAPCLTHLGVQVPLTPKTRKPSVDKFLLASVKHPVARALERARKVNKLRTTFAASVRAHLTAGRIHCVLNQLRKTEEGSEEDEGDEKGAAYGRLSCEHPNMQQQPARDEFARVWRSIYLPEEGQLWNANDFSQQEPRWTIHYAEELGLPRAFDAAEKYRRDPSTDNHQMMADMAQIKRKPAKEIFLGLVYGMGGPKLCGKLGLPTRYLVRLGREVEPYDTPRGKALAAEGGQRFLAAGEEAQALLDKFDRELPFLRKLAKAAERKAKSAGFVRTAGGRRCRFPKDLDGNFDWCHKALNRVIQGSSADQTKLSVVLLDEAGFWMMLQVHDEVANSVETEAEGLRAAEIMRDCMPMRVPSKVDAEFGPSWGESMKDDNGNTIRWENLTWS